MDNKYNAHESSPNHLPHPCVFHKTSPWCQKSWGPLICSKWRKFLTTIESVKIKQVIFVLFIFILQLLVTLRLFSNKKFKKQLQHHVSILVKLDIIVLPFRFFFLFPPPSCPFPFPLFSHSLSVCLFWSLSFLFPSPSFLFPFPWHRDEYRQGICSLLACSTD